MTIAPRRLRGALKACCLVVTFASPAAAQEAPPPGAAIVPAPEIEMQTPRVSFAEVDWAAARVALAGIDPLALNAATEKLFPKIDISPVPVLLPFDTAAYLKDDAAGSLGDISKYFSGNQTLSFFFAGPSGYDALLSLQPHMSGLDLSFDNRVDVQISGSALLYELGEPALAEESAVPELEGDFPEIRRVLLEERVRYIFTRFGVPYVLSILCKDGPNSARRLSCHEADKVAARVLKALTVVGGSPRSAETKTVAPTIERPDRISPDFTYYAPGDIIPGSGMKGQGGRADTTVYAKIRFPMAAAPAYANSQSFMNWGDCDHTGRVGDGGDGKNAAYHCRVNSVPLVHDESKNFAYPWRDNFCEHRYYYVGQCPSGFGHQGQDIRPGSCLLRNEGADRCEPYWQDVVAAADGVIMRAPGDKALYLIVNKPGEHIRFRYLHMNPQMLDAAGIVSGRAVGDGEVIGKVANYGRYAGGTTYHLHFDMQVPSRDGWVFASPYMTLVAAYERLIDARGRVVRDAVVTTASVGTPATDGEAGIPATANIAPSNAIIAPERESAREHKTASAERCTTRVVKGHRRHHCVDDSTAGSARSRHGVRSVDRGVSHEGRRARHHGGDLHARHARGSSRHHGA